MRSCARMKSRRRATKAANGGGVFPAPGFSPLAEQLFAYVHEGAAERVIVERVLSVSYIAALGEADRAKVAEDVRGLIAATPDFAGREPVAYPYETIACWCRKL